MFEVGEQTTSQSVRVLEAWSGSPCPDADADRGGVGSVEPSSLEDCYC